MRRDVTHFVTTPKRKFSPSFVCSRPDLEVDFEGVMEGSDRFAYNDVFDLDLDQIKSVGHSLVAIQSRVNDTVSKFNETMDDTDGLGDLRMLNASKIVPILIKYWCSKKGEQGAAEIGCRIGTPGRS